MHFEVVWTNRHLIWKGLKLTLELSGVIIVAGSVLGLLVGVGLLYGNRVIRTLLRLYVDIIRGTPMLVIIFLIYYGLPALNINVSGHHVNTNLGRFQTAAIAFSVFAGAHIGEIVRGAIGSIPKGQTDAAKSIGLTFWPRLLLVLTPQSLPIIIPPWTNTAAELIKGTSLVTLVSLSDLLFATQKVSARTNSFLTLYGAAAIIYFVLCFSVSRTGVLVSRRFRYGTS
jgi:polar amino acid transport system permease protein